MKDKQYELAMIKEIMGSYDSMLKKEFSEKMY